MNLVCLRLFSFFARGAIEIKGSEKANIGQSEQALDSRGYRFKNRLQYRSASSLVSLLIRSCGEGLFIVSILLLLFKFFC